MVENPLSDMMIRIKNGYLTGQKTVQIPYSKTRERLAEILIQGGYLAKKEIEKIKLSSKKKAVEVKIIKVDLRYEKREPALMGLKIVSKSSHRIYVKKGEIPHVLGGRGIVILSTPQGLMTGQEARKKDLGGEVICEVW